MYNYRVEESSMVVYTRPGATYAQVVQSAEKLGDLLRNVHLSSDIHLQGEVGKRLTVFRSSQGDGVASREPLHTDYMVPEALFQFSEYPRLVLDDVFELRGLAQFFTSTSVWCISLASVSLIDPMSDTARLLRFAIEHGNFDPNKLGTTILFDADECTVKVVRLPQDFSTSVRMGKGFNVPSGEESFLSVNFREPVRFPADLEWCVLVIETLRKQLFPYLAV